MNKILKSIILISSLYIISFFFYGKYSLKKRIITDSHSTYEKFKWTKEVTIISNTEFKNLEEITNDIFGKEANIELQNVENESELIPMIKKIKNYKYILFFETYSPWLNLSESENIQEYVAIWNRQYLWCFCCWIKIHDTLEATS